MMHGWMGSWENGPMGWWGGAWMILFWALVIGGIVIAIRWMNARSGAVRQEHSPLEILKARYARGEIDKAEFGEKKQALM